MRLVYADPPYPGNAHYYPEQREVDHAALIAELETFDGWALSTGSTNLTEVIPLCPTDVRVAAWVKPWVSFKAAAPAYSWQPVIFYPPPGRGGRANYYGRDFISCKPTTKRGIVGAKPPAVLRWIAYDLLRYHPDDDELVDLFPGTGVLKWAVAQAELLR